MFSLPIMSLIRHQEPRFLLPLFIPFTIIAGKQLYSSSLLRVLWIIHCISFIMLFGLLHQAGVVPSVIYFSQYNQMHTGNNTVHLVYYHTYMPPRHLLAYPAYQSNANESWLEVHDTAGTNILALNALLIQLSTKHTNSKIFLVCPATVNVSHIEEHGQVKLLTQFLHLSLEDPPDLSTSITQFLSLNIYSYKGKLSYLRNHSLGLP